MRLITNFELANRTDVELSILFHMISQSLGSTSPGTPARRKAVASLQNISRARSKRYKHITVPGF